MNSDQQAKNEKPAVQQKMMKPLNSQEGRREEHTEQAEQGGKQIQDFYITKQNLGKGAFGSVFIAYKLTKEGKKNGKFAAKVIQLTSLNDKEIIQLTREIEILKTIRHDNIVKMVHVTRTKNNLYLFLEYIKDGDLSKHLESKRRLSQEETIFFFRQIVNGFKELYKRNIIHRDIKPENILLEKKENQRRLLISDFGFARVLSQDQMNKQIEQTPVGNAELNKINIQELIIFFSYYLISFFNSFFAIQKYLAKNVQTQKVKMNLQQVKEQIRRMKEINSFKKEKLEKEKKK